jgi:hypothetical protein
MFVPELDLQSLEILTPINGVLGIDLSDQEGSDKIGDEEALGFVKKLKIISDDLSRFLSMEKDWDTTRKSSLLLSAPHTQVQLQLQSQGQGQGGERGERDSCTPTPQGVEDGYDLAEKWVELLGILDPTFGHTTPGQISFSPDQAGQQSTLHPTHTLRDEDTKYRRSNSSNGKKDEIIRIPIGESVVLSAKFRNRLSTKVNLTDLSMEIQPHEILKTPPSSVSLSPGESSNVLVRAEPAQIGSYQVLKSSYFFIIFHFLFIYLFFYFIFLFRTE